MIGFGRWCVLSIRRSWRRRCVGHQPDTSLAPNTPLKSRTLRSNNFYCNLRPRWCAARHCSAARRRCSGELARSCRARLPAAASAISVRSSHPCGPCGAACGRASHRRLTAHHAVHRDNRRQLRLEGLREIEACRRDVAADPSPDNSDRCRGSGSAAGRCAARSQLRPQRSVGPSSQLRSPAAPPARSPAAYISGHTAPSPTIFCTARLRHLGEQYLTAVAREQRQQSLRSSMLDPIDVMREPSAICDCVAVASDVPPRFASWMPVVRRTSS